MLVGVSNAFPSTTILPHTSHAGLPAMYPNLPLNIRSQFYTRRAELIVIPPFPPLLFLFLSSSLCGHFGDPSLPL